MNFDRIAPLYRWLEWMAFGSQLQRARIALVGEIGPVQRVLVVGEGDGRFLAEFVRVHPSAAIDCVEASGRMIALARKRRELRRVRFVQADIREVALPVDHFDLIVTHFVLDCFDAESLTALIPKLATSARPEAHWLVADFCQPPRGGWRRLRARFLISFMYRFFRVTAGLEARSLVDYHGLLQSAGFGLTKSHFSLNEMVRSECWRRELPPG